MSEIILTTKSSGPGLSNEEGRKSPVSSPRLKRALTAAPRIHAEKIQDSEAQDEAIFTEAKKEQDVRPKSMVNIKIKTVNHRRKSHIFFDSFDVDAALHALEAESKSPSRQSSWGRTRGTSSPSVYLSGVNRGTNFQVSDRESRTVATTTVPHSKMPKFPKLDRLESARSMVRTLSTKGKSVRLDDEHIGGEQSTYYRGTSEKSEKFGFQYEVTVRPGFEPVDRRRNEEGDALGLKEKKCQDAVSVEEMTIKGKDWFHAGVYDGHGRQGTQVAHYVAQRLPHAVEELLGQGKSVKAAFKAACDNVLCGLGEESGIDAYFSGSTAAFCFVEHAGGGKVLHAASVGDARLILGTATAQAIAVTTEHRPNAFWENLRIWWHGGTVRQVDERGNEDLRAPFRIFDKSLVAYDQWTPGIAISRSLGDLAASGLGVTAQPSVSKVTLTAEHRFMLLASDGIWDVFTPQEAVTFITKVLDKGVDAENASLELVAEAQERWRGFVKRSEWCAIDDISVIVVLLNC